MRLLEKDGKKKEYRRKMLGRRGRVLEKNGKNVR